MGRPGASPRRREAERRRRRREARRRGPAADVAPEARPAAAPQKARDVSWLGLVGGLTGCLPLAALGLELLTDPPEAGRWAAVPLLAIAAVYLPAVWVSLRPAARRRAVQRGVVAATIVMMLAGLPFYGPGLAAVLLIPTALLAIAAGLVWGR